MGIESQIQMSHVNAIIKEKIEAAENVIINTLGYIGEMCVNEARDKGSYTDQTGNLRSSIGYVVAKNGSKVYENIKQSEKGTDKGTGVNEAKRFVNELVAKYDKGIVLIVVAGMNYATHVESRKNVLASAHLLAQKVTPKMLKKIGFTKVA